MINKYIYTHTLRVGSAIPQIFQDAPFIHHFEAPKFTPGPVDTFRLGTDDPDGAGAMDV